jgi:hypothetical protein
MWELPEELMDDGKPFVISKFYTNSLNEKATLRADLMSWRGRDFTSEELRGFDLQSILGAPCLINVVHDENKKAKVTSVAKLPKNITIPAAVNAPFAFWLDEFDQKKFESLSKGLQAIISRSPEYESFGKGLQAITKKSLEHKSLGKNLATEDMADDVPW